MMDDDCRGVSVGRIRGECCKCFLAPPQPPHPSNQHHYHYSPQPVWLLNCLNPSCRWSDLAGLRCETISPGPRRPPTATDPQPHPPRSLLLASICAHPADHFCVAVGRLRLFFFSLSFSGRDSLSAGPSAANYIKFPAHRRRRRIAAGAVY